ncbi:MAG: DOPA 4,5-dioxygenase family protein [Minwuia sp.]|uniref:DOPA 4,5-dioxygenase family protein n=1 Tax=Minwuia sp. TaxID=2493630 RepID=UPI003A8C6CC2
MTDHPNPRPASDIEGYHAHIYYRNDAEKAEAAVLRSQLSAVFEVELGRWRDQPVGPHPLPMYQVAFGVEEFPEFVPWLMLNRRDLTILIHPRTGEDVPDHETFPLWLGEKLPLDVEFLRQFDRA